MNLLFENLMNSLFPVKSEAQYDTYIDKLDELMEAETLSEEEELTLEHLSILIDAYEQDNVEINTSSLKPLDLIRFKMDQMGLKQKDLTFIGSSGVISEVLNGKRQLNLKMIKTVAEHLDIPVQLLV
ncbi:type II toxin-antitoxin system HigA family antitoxin [Flammeovirga sp. SJP92]|uniref:helix-turn-helix domain-containing protein n=1 Tax=Flammeovirga sp. SJP92 TaxID=1775430 RepID=UPI000786CA6B|nr:transcriptional regulator [Flammeovirga sp. SJP92]KXX68031.1 hypothetical protein AVL50_24590 [Flammeovirga sp. SJP92]